MKNRNIYLLRHGQPNYPSGDKRCISKTDYHLNEIGVCQGNNLQTLLCNKNIISAFSSPYARAKETAEIILSKDNTKDNTLVIDERFAEMSAGDWENMKFSDIRRKYPEWYMKRGENLWDVPTLNGESFHQAGMRMYAAMNEIVEKTDGNLFVVAHEGINRGFLCLIGACDKNEILGFPQPYGCCNHLTYSNGRFQIHSLGEVPAS